VATKKALSCSDVTQARFKKDRVVAGIPNIHSYNFVN